MTFRTIVGDLIGSLAVPVVSVIASLIVVYFVWNTFRFIRASEDKDRKEYRSAMIYSVLVLAVAFSFWGLVAVLQQTFSIGSGSNDIHGQVESLFKK